MIVIKQLYNRDAAVARQIHAVQMLAYTQEALLLGVSDFPPLRSQAEDVRSSSECFIGAFQEEVLVGVLAFEPDEEEHGQQLITSLVVHPEHQRKGYARALMIEFLRLNPASVIAVSTAAANTPALALYRGMGFSEYRWGTVGSEALAIVKLRHLSFSNGTTRT